MSRFNPSSEDKLAGNQLSQLPRLNGARDGSVRDDSRMHGRSDAELILDHIPVEMVGEMSDGDMLRIARQCYDTSEDYFNASHRTRIMDAMARFRSMHPRGSKYWLDAYLRRSKTFRPKTRAMVRKREAAAVMSMFSTSDVVNISACNNGDAMAAKDARIQAELLNSRLKEDARWYQVVIGSVQDADRQGIVCACTEWEYRESTKYYDQKMSDGTRNKMSVVTPVQDRANMRLVPIENIKISPAANWLDLVNSTPYLIEVKPMFVCEIREYARNPRARLKYRDLTDGELMSGTKSAEWDPIRIQREGNKQDRYARQGEINEYAVVWVHRNIVRIEGEDYIYDTVGTTMMLSDVVPLSSVDPRGYRPYVIGMSMIESHNPNPEGAVTLMGPLQDEINETANLRQDMNKMATSGRMFVKRTAGVDLHNLARFAPGAAVEMDDPTSVRWDRPPPPPSTNFEENNLLNTELDDLIGNFSQGSVAGNKQLNETVGGMQMLSGSADQITEYDLRTLAKTFFEPLLRQYLDLHKLYETDRDMASMIGSKYQISEIQYWKSLQTATQLSLEVGYGATNPMGRLERLSTGMEFMGKFFPYLMMMADQSEIASEVFAACGYDNAERFFPFLDQKALEDPKYKTLVMQLDQLRMLSFPHIAEAQGRQQQGQAQAAGAVQSATVAANARITIAREANAAAEKQRQDELKRADMELKLEQEQTQIQRDQLMLAREQLASDIAVAQEGMIIKAQSSPLLQPHALEGPIPTEEQDQVSALRSPGSGDVPETPGLEGLFNSASKKTPPAANDSMTGGDLSKLFGSGGQ